MEIEWTPPENFPPKLYRVTHPYTATTYAPNTGIKCLIPRTEEHRIRGVSHKSIARFYSSINSHLQQKHERLIPLSNGNRKWVSGTAYISLFEDLSEAESWALAAEEVFGDGKSGYGAEIGKWRDGKGKGDANVWIVEIDTKHPDMRKVKLWKVSDIEACAIKDGWEPFGGMGERAKSEWLALWRIPGSACKLMKNSWEVRRERQNQKPRFDLAHVHTVPDGHPDESTVNYDDPTFLGRATFVRWEPCDCVYPWECTHVGPFDAPQIQPPQMR